MNRLKEPLDREVEVDVRNYPFIELSSKLFRCEAKEGWRDKDRVLCTFERDHCSGHGSGAPESVVASNVAIAALAHGGDNQLV